MSALRRRALALTVAATLVVPTALTTTGLTSADAVVPLGATSSQGLPSPAALARTHPGVARLLSAGTPNHRAIVTFAAVPTQRQLTRLRGLGLQVQGMSRLPLAVVSGTTAELLGSITHGVGRDVYPDESHEYFDTTSSDAMSSSPAAAAGLRARGFTGKGVTVGVVDSGCDATHPDLADHVVHNIKLVSGEYGNLGTQPTLVVPVDMGPFSNSDIGGGHGTHVAGIVAADGTTSKTHLGVAPDAKLACFSIGEGLFTTAVVTAYDYVLKQPGLLGIDVMNNSWGNSYRQFDPHDPVAVATRAVARQGVTVVFAAGNSGSGGVSASLNPFSQSPWVISVAAGDDERVRADFSSNGLIYDNSRPVAQGATKAAHFLHHTIFMGDRIGVVHPDVMGAGVDVSSTCDVAGSVVGPCPPGQNTNASGTSMASPHVAGCAAVLLQAQPRLTPTQVRQALQVTATPAKNADGKGRAPFWQTGYGYVNLDKAVALVRSQGWAGKLAKRQRLADRRVLRADRTTVVRSDFFVFRPLPATVAGVDHHNVKLNLRKGTEKIVATLAFPSAGTAGASVFSYTVKVTDRNEKVLATSTTDRLGGSGTATVTLDLKKRHLKPGTYYLKLTGDQSASDPDTIDSDSVLGRFLTLQVARLRATR